MGLSRGSRPHRLLRPGPRRGRTIDRRRGPGPCKSRSPHWIRAGLGIAAVAVGVAQAALDEATRYANERTTFGRKIIDHQGLGFLLADMAAAWPAPARPILMPRAGATWTGRIPQQASVAKLVATDAAMRVTTDAVQVFGGVGYTRDFRVERYMREAKITQIFEGTNQIQRLVIARGLTV